MRWRRTRPWLVLSYDTIVGAVTATLLLLALLQPLLVHGCTLCVISAAIALMIAWLAHEVLASMKLIRGE